MKFHHLVKHVVERKKEKNESKGKGHHLFWWQLLLIGIGSIIGAGFFLGTGLSISTAGPSVLIGYLVAGITAYFVFSALAEMSVYDPQEGSFRTYARKAFGHSFGFSTGWIYWLSGLLIMSSENIALSTFMKFWFPHVPLYVFAILFALLALGINLMGVDDFGKVESLFAVIKLSTLVIFVLFGVLFLIGIINPNQTLTVHNFSQANQTFLQSVFPHQFKGLWAAMIFIFFSFGGIAVVGIASSEIKVKQNIPKVGKYLLSILTIIYILSLFMVLKIVPFGDINAEASPFVRALNNFNIPYIDSIFNFIIITAAFSTMTGAFYSITSVLVSLAHDGDAPKSLAKKNSRNVPTKALYLSTICLSVSIILAGILPSAVYEYITTAAGIMLILNWVIILASHMRLHKNYVNTKASKIHKYHMMGSPYTNVLAIIIILFTIAGAALNPKQRVGLIVTAGLIVIIGICYFIFRSIHHDNPPQTDDKNQQE